MHLNKSGISGHGWLTSGPQDPRHIILVPASLQGKFQGKDHSYPLVVSWGRHTRIPLFMLG